jgi:hypothetical protein
MISFKRFLKEVKKPIQRPAGDKSRFSWNKDDITIKIPKKLKEDFQHQDGSPEHPILGHADIDVERTKLNAEHKRLSKISINRESKMSDEHINAIRKYKKSSRQLNLYHRDNKKFNHDIDTYADKEDREPQKKEAADHTKHLDHVTSHKTTKDMHVYRGFGYDMSIHSLPKDAELHDKGYVSTSLNKNKTHNFSGAYTNTDGHVVSTIAKIHIPKGTKGHYLDNESDKERDYSHEKEFLLHRGTHFKVLHHEYDADNKYHIVHMTVHKQD